MMPCVYNENDKCKLYSDEKHTSWCVNGPCADQRLSNGDRIRAMRDEEQARFLEGFSACAVCREAERLDDNPLLRGEKCDEDCETHILEWLKQPVE